MIDPGKRVQLAGGTFDVEGYLVGLSRELRVDTSNDSLRLHDGVKEGGFEFLNRDSSDARYQRRSLELDGFKFGAQEKGILVRVSPSNYKLRRFNVNQENMSVTNPRGTAGDIYFSLTETISDAHIWTGDNQFTQPIDGAGGFVGNVTGDVVGDLTGDSTGTHTGPVLGNAAGDHTGSFTGDVDVRGHEILFDDGQIPEEAIDPQAFTNRGIPYGGIIMWAGLEDDIPDSWAICDGENGTPDLRDRFVLGASGTVSAHTVGGSASIQVLGEIAMGGEHSHDLEITPVALSVNQMPRHRHKSGVCDNTGSFFNRGFVAAAPHTPSNPETGSSDGTVEAWTDYAGLESADPANKHTHAGSTAIEGGAHTHEITLDSVTHRPPYYALCFLMKIV